MKKSDKIFKFIGQAVVYLAFCGMWAGIFIYGFLQNTIY